MVHFPTRSTRNRQTIISSRNIWISFYQDKYLCIALKKRYVCVSWILLWLGRINATRRGGSTVTLWRLHLPIIFLSKIRILGLEIIASRCRNGSNLQHDWWVVTHISSPRLKLAYKLWASGLKFPPKLQARQTRQEQIVTNKQLRNYLVVHFCCGIV